MMDEFTTRFFDAALRGFKVQGCQPRPDDLIARAWHLYIAWRDAILEAWAGSTLAHVPEEKLLALTDIVLDMLAVHGEWWDEPEPGEEAETVAWGLAVLRWLNQENRRRAPTLQYTEGEVEMMIYEAYPIQLSLW